ncbi:MAG: carbohydrate kinase [Oscillospiraceae bacterium]|nr:carbohydrate kinase [Oscillospiraceae bacterium]
MKNARYDVAALGELLIDFTQHGSSEQGNPLFEANPGGAPANVLAMLTKLGRRCAFLGKVGQDAFGDRLAQTLRSCGVDDRGLRRDGLIPTTLAVVHTLPGGDRDFSFYRKPGADLLLREDELDLPLLRDCRVFHFGTLSLTDEPCRSATRRAIREAREAGALISFDPNLRMPLWNSAEEAREAIAWGLSQCEVLKISDNELAFMTGEEDLEKAAALLRGQYPQLRLCCVTAGAAGSTAYCGALRAFEPACGRGGIVDTTGAGDTFCACMLDFVLANGLENTDEAALHRMLRFANHAAYLVATKKGAIRSMPEREQVEALLR